MTITTCSRWSSPLRDRPWLAIARLWGAVAVWTVVVAIGFGLLLRHQGTAGEALEPPADFPASAAHLRSAKPYTLLLFAHPQCPCTRASLQELSRLIAHVPEAANVQVIFPRLSEVGTTWDEAPVVQFAGNVHGAQTSWDDNGRLARIFGARTSGHTLLYDVQGRLLFSGGLTSLRAHEGASTGNQAVLAHLRGESTAPASAPVFGCSLFDPLAETGAP